MKRYPKACPDCRGGWQCERHQRLGVKEWNATQATLRAVSIRQQQAERDRIAARYELESDEFSTADEKAKAYQERGIR